MPTTAPAATRNGGDPHTASPGAYDRLAAIVDDIPDEIAQLDAERERVTTMYQDRMDVLRAEREAAVGGLDEKRKQLNALLKAMGREPIEIVQRRPNRSIPRGGSAAPTRGLRAERCLVVCKELLTRDGVFAAGDVQDAVKADWPITSTNSLFSYLRHREVLGFVRREPVKHGRDLYRVLHREAVDEWRLELEGEIATKAGN